MKLELPLIHKFPPSNVQVTLRWNGLAFGAAPSPASPAEFAPLPLSPLQLTHTPAFILFMEIIPKSLRETAGASLLTLFAQHGTFNELVVPLQLQPIFTPERVPLYTCSNWVHDIHQLLVQCLRNYGMSRIDFLQVQKLLPTEWLPRHQPRWPQLDLSRPILLLVLGCSRQIVFHRHDKQEDTTTFHATFHVRSGDVLLLKSGVPRFYDLTVAPSSDARSGPTLLLHWRCVLPTSI